jgi:hypothetical protein
MLVEVVVVRAKVYVPFPWTRLLTSTETQCFDVNPPDKPVIVEDGEGAFA